MNIKQILLREKLTLFMGLKFVEELQIARQSELLPESPPHGLFHRFILTGMTTTTVRPKERPQSFPRAPLLEQEFTVAIEHED